ncbi:MAG: hypothetical protein A3I07_04260 [Candidatus Doudnabacteria bacterium RIFCSPLOWO2_02_FULL_42_9]|uniref:Uncharacterized protein n=1 Tax=Candidatus Doudnabacteria bacterium RIFCSPHIGHO2_01_FULL_41_86 TaxID=1817821 RepID=A0A1F5N8I7_9BACT|nr:MAG: hypothetical protein A2717_00160 [Candidatus Doudnabacteria bacterium RIFCSPHIGHO2_01_FULL_41_86]OGE75104.1 MAG: hypothetical protein A3K07_03665 [Candidatus Doudnabacteria bacterium RIFCSPHIGHO2_01_43_10]OGE86365.1 MAG: hypothetical protein A3E28_00035 [Candidatus Doudnabacteria bacterium RIFCSPHIGHO2_12_FULL_42_22]OGE87364.1 MAG: hypothetical protein A3C49_04020 [Candidatus Doudnabacteria bacterium RIFCSPHIGHO2_02_FULL_42_25]OGE92662.1 MAG: hypothetical protein A2895_03515 [Candidatus
MKMSQIPKGLYQRLNKAQVCQVAIKDGQGYDELETLSFSLSDVPLNLYFSVEKNNIKYSKLLEGKLVDAFAVARVENDKEWFTFQIEGKLAVIDKNPVEVQKLFLEFTPTWWEYTDYKTKPPIIINSSKGR